VTTSREKPCSSSDNAGAYVRGRLTARPLSRTTRHPGIPGASSAALLSHHSVRLSVLVLDDLYNLASLFALDLETSHSWCKSKPCKVFLPRSQWPPLTRWLKATHRHSGSRPSMNSTSCELRASPSRMYHCAYQYRSRYVATFPKSCTQSRCCSYGEFERLGRYTDWCVRMRSLRATEGWYSWCYMSLGGKIPICSPHRTHAPCTKRLQTSRRPLALLQTTGIAFRFAFCRSLEHDQGRVLSLLDSKPENRNSWINGPTTCERRYALASTHDYNTVLRS
jgi:hypothetical protein